MQLEDFINRMNAIQVPITELDKTKYSEDFLNSVRNNYKFYPKSKKYTFTNPILRLITEYNCQKVEIGLITFDEIITEDDDYYYFGKFEADELVINKKTAEIELREFGQNHTICYCAKNAVSFLIAILTVAEFESKFSIDEDSNKNEVCEVVKKSSIEAGELSRYKTFYQSLLGCEK